MRKVARNSLMTVAAAGSVLAATAGYANAVGSGAHGTASDSPGVASGNTVQVPVDIPVEVCNNTINVVGLLNPALGGACHVDSGSHSSSVRTHDTHGKETRREEVRREESHHTGALAEGSSKGSPGVLSGNTVQLPIHVPVEVCGNSIDIVGIGNTAADSDCEIGAEAPKPRPAKPHRPEEKPKPHTRAPEHHEQISHRAVQDPQVDPREQLAQTGADSLDVLAPAGAAALLAGAVLYRRARARQH
ncbi:chaplin [Streptomyces palmae]|uniref:Chaplin n=1 Tax=Streptomyces palmae TaxID=1701085 RepID=A0A4Z0HBN7_9ACTN|nr:chaplin [Streptomyces palmae]TGB07679.1 chaplin [Streptomyces palmae]